jgi:hypothetical protein
MDYSDILQDISVDLSFMVKKHLKNIKKLDSKQQKQFGKLFGDMKQGIDDLSEGVNEGTINEVPNPDVIRKNASGYVGTKFAKKADDHDIIKMVQLKDQSAKVYNQQLLPFHKEIGELYKKYKIKSIRGVEK